VGTDAGSFVRPGGASGLVVFSSAGPAEGVPPRGAKEARNVLSRRGRAVAGLAEPVAALAGAAGEARGEVIVATGRGHGGDPPGTDLWEVAWCGLCSFFSHRDLPGYVRQGYSQVGKPQTGDEGTWQQGPARAAADAAKEKRKKRDSVNEEKEKGTS
jgi:hypothetical protein